MKESIAKYLKINKIQKGLKNLKNFDGGNYSPNRADKLTSSHFETGLGNSFILLCFILLRILYLRIAATLLSTSAALSPAGWATRNHRSSKPVLDGPEKRLPARRCGCNRLENVNREDNDPARVVHRAKITFSVLEILDAMYIKVIRFARGRPAILTSTSHPFVQFYLLSLGIHDSRVNWTPRWNMNVN